METTGAAGRATEAHATPQTAPSSSPAPLLVESAPANAAAERPAPNLPGGFTFYARKTFLWKSILLLATTIALVPILLLKNTGWAQVYLWSLVVVHVAGIFVVAIGVRRHQLAPDRRGLVIRLIGIAMLLALLGLAAKGLNPDGASGWIFWGSLFAIWALHTAGLALLHIRSGRERSVCPFA